MNDTSFYIPINVKDLHINTITNQPAEFTVSDSVLFNACSPITTFTTKSQINTDNIVVCLAQHDSINLNVCAYLSGVVDTLVSGTSPSIYLGIVNNDTVSIDTLNVKVRLYNPNDSIRYDIFIHQLTNLKPGEDFVSSQVQAFQWPVQLEQGSYSLEIDMYYKQYYLTSKSVTYHLKNPFDQLPVLSVKPTRLNQYQGDSVSFDISIITSVRSYDSTTLAFKWKTYTIDVIDIPVLNAWDTITFTRKVNLSYQSDAFKNDSVEFLIYKLGDTLCRAKSILKLSKQQLVSAESELYRQFGLSTGAPQNGLVDYANAFGYSSTPEFQELNRQPTHILRNIGTQEKLYGFPYKFALLLKHADSKETLSQQMTNMDLKCTFYLTVTDTLLSKSTIVDSLVLTKSDFSKITYNTKLGSFEYSGIKKYFAKPIDIQSVLTKFPNTYDFFAYFSLKTNYDSILVSAAPYLHRIYFHVDKNTNIVNSNLIFYTWPSFYSHSYFLFDSIGTEKANYRVVVVNGGSVPAFEVGVYAVTPRAAYYLNSDSLMEAYWNIGNNSIQKKLLYQNPNIFKNPQAYDSLFTYVGLINGVAKAGSATQELLYSGPINKDRIGYVFLIDPFDKLKEISEYDNFVGGGVNPDDVIVPYCKNGVDIAHITTGSTEAPFIAVPGIVNDIKYNAQGVVKISEGTKLRVSMNLHKYGRRASTGGVLAVKVIPIPHQTIMRMPNYRDIDSIPISFTVPLPSFTTNINSPNLPMIRQMEFEFIPSNYINLGEAFALVTRVDPDMVTGDCNVGQYFPSRLLPNDYTYNWSGFVLGTANVIVDNLETAFKNITEVNCGQIYNIGLTLKNVDASFGTTNTFYVHMTDNMGNSASIPVNGIKAGESKMVSIPFSVKRAYRDKEAVPYTMNLILDLSNTIALDSIKTYQIQDTLKVKYAEGGLAKPTITTFKDRNLTWKPVSGATGYEYTIYTTWSNSSSRVVLKTGFTTNTSFIGFGFYSDGTYYAEVKAYNDYCGLSSSIAQTYYTSPPPPPSKAVVINNGGTTSSEPRPDDKPEVPSGCQYGGLPVYTELGKKCGNPNSLSVRVTNNKSYPIDVCVCIYTKDGKRDCGSFTLNPNSHGWNYSCNTTKKYTVKWKKSGASCKVCD